MDILHRAAVVRAAEARRSGLKWLLVIIICAHRLLPGRDRRRHYLTHAGYNHGVTVVRMEGTMVTGHVNDGDQHRQRSGGQPTPRGGADDPMVEAIVLRVNSPGGSPAGSPGDHRGPRIREDEETAWSSPWGKWPRPRHTMSVRMPTGSMRIPIPSRQELA